MAIRWGEPVTQVIALYGEKFIHHGENVGLLALGRFSTSARTMWCLAAPISYGAFHESA